MFVRVVGATLAIVVGGAAFPVGAQASHCTEEQTALQELIDLRARYAQAATADGSISPEESAQILEVTKVVNAAAATLRACDATPHPTPGAPPSSGGPG